MNQNQLTSENIRELWARILNAISSHNATNLFNEGADIASIMELQEKMRLSIPSSVATFLQCQNGCMDYFDQILIGCPLLSLDEIYRDWKINCEVNADSPHTTDETILDDLWWHRRMMPVAGADGDSICVDTLTGKVYSHIHDQGLGESIATSIVEWLGKLADQLEKGDAMKDENGKLVIGLEM